MGATGTALLLVFATILPACTSFSPQPPEDVPFLERAKSEVSADLTVTVAVPTVAEAEALYGVPLASKGMQPIWLEVENTGAVAFWFLPAGLDPHYFSPTEAAYAFHRGRSSRAAAIDAHFEALEFDNPIPPGGTTSGFVLVNLQEGYRAVDVDLICKEDARSFTFVAVDPDFRGDFKRVDLDSLWSAAELVEVSDEDELRAAVERLPASTSDKGGKAAGDPLNVVLIGERAQVLAALVRRGWHATELVSSGSLWRTTKAYFSGSRYRHSPISPLYVYGRPQDFSAQKARGSINERNHMRYWLTPIRFRGRDVWVGQISRDIGVKFTLKSPTISTHKIDPDVDEARRYLAEDMVYSQALETVGFAAGLGEVSVAEPRMNLVGDPYFTDGLRLVMFFEDRPNALDDIVFLKWALPASRETLFE